MWILKYISFNRNSIFEVSTSQEFFKNAPLPILPTTILASYEALPSLPYSPVSSLPFPMLA